MRRSPWASSNFGRWAATGGRAGVTFTRSTVDGSAGQPECLPHHRLHLRTLCVGRFPEGDEAHFFAAALEQSAMPDVTTVMNVPLLASTFDIWCGPTRGL